MRISSMVVVALMLAGGASGQRRYTITTVAGADALRDGAAFATMLENAAGLAVDAGGSLYVADSGANRIRKVNPDPQQKSVGAGYGLGVIETISGAGGAYFGGDGGPAGLAQLSNPSSLAFDFDGSLFIADAGNRRIRKITTDGVIATIAGNGALPVARCAGQEAATAAIAAPLVMARDGAGNLFFADSSDRICKISTDGVLTAYAGGGELGLAADGGPATQAELEWISAMATDAAGNLYVAERERHTVRRISTDGRISTVAGTGEEGHSGDGGLAVKARLNAPLALAVGEDETIYVSTVAMGAPGTIRRIGRDGVISTLPFPLEPPVAMTVHPSGALVLSFGRRVSVLMPGASGFDGPAVGELSGYGADGVSALQSVVWFPGGAAYDEIGRTLYIAQMDAFRMVDWLGVIHGTEIAVPVAMALDVDGAPLLADAFSIQKLTKGGLEAYAGTGKAGYSGDGGRATAAELWGVRGLATDGAGNTYVADSSNQVIRKVSADGVMWTIAGTGERGWAGDGGRASEAQLYYPTALAADGRTGELYMVDQRGSMIRRVDAAGVVQTVYASSERIVALAVDTDSTLLFCAGHAIYRLSSVLEVVAGGAVPGFAGDGGPAGDALLNSPSSLFVDGQGAIYVADRANHRVRKLEAVRESGLSVGR
ncbi:MAG: hypothetical protein IPP47_06030 [Bryobacterales bacterium]|nr:hypothetical protein [Bryobacterales bacterium]